MAKRDDARAAAKFAARIPRRTARAMTTVEPRRGAPPAGDDLRAAEERRRDGALMAAAASGESAAARVIVAENAPRVLAVARRLLGDAAEAEDATQEAMMRLWRIAPDWDPEVGRIGTWLHRVVTNLCYDRLRRRRAERLDATPDGFDAPDPAPSALAAMEAAETAGAIRAALSGLPERQRQAVMLRHFEDRSNPEIAEALDVSVEAVESLLARGRRALKAALAAGTPRAAGDEGERR